MLLYRCISNALQHRIIYIYFLTCVTKIKKNVGAIICLTFMWLITLFTMYFNICSLKIVLVQTYFNFVFIFAYLFIYLSC